MYNDSIETLLLRHYGSTAPTPPMLEQQLVACARQAVADVQQQNGTIRLQQLKVSRRRAVRLVAIGSAGLGLLSIGLESLQALEAALVGQNQDAVQPALS